MTSASEQGTPGGEPYDWYQRASELLITGNSNAAIILFERVLREENSPAVLEGLGRALFDAGRYEQCVDVFEQLVATSPDNDYAHFALGLGLWRLQRFITARDHLAMAFVMRPDRSDYATSLAQVKATLRSRVEDGLPLEGPIEGQENL
jgi:tetratricopeptide (TPR) repeat protein